MCCSKAPPRVSGSKALPASSKAAKALRPSLRTQHIAVVKPLEYPIRRKDMGKLRRGVGRMVIAFGQLPRSGPAPVPVFGMGSTGAGAMSGIQGSTSAVGDNFDRGENPISKFAAPKTFQKKASAGIVRLSWRGWRTDSGPRAPPPMLEQLARQVRRNHRANRCNANGFIGHVRQHLVCSAKAEFMKERGARRRKEASPRADAFGKVASRPSTGDCTIGKFRLRHRMALHHAPTVFLTRAKYHR